MENPSPVPDPSEIKKFEIRKQPGITEKQAQHATAWLNLTQLLEKVIVILSGQHLDDITALAITGDDLAIGEKALKENERWKGIFTVAKQHQELTLKLLKEQLEVTRQTQTLVGGMAKLKTDQRIIEESERLLKILDALEAHRKSGLLETISKL